MLRRKSLVEEMTVNGHFIFTSGRHATQKLVYERVGDRYFKERRAAKSLGALIAETFPDVDGLVGVADGAKRLSRKTAKVVSRILGRTVLNFETSKTDDGGFRLTRGGVYVNEKRLVIVDDVFTRGTNSSKVAGVIHKFGGIIDGVSVLANRNIDGLDWIPYPDNEQQGYVDIDELNGQTNVAIPVVSVYDAPMVDYHPDECPWSTAGCPGDKEFILQS